MHADKTTQSPIHWYTWCHGIYMIDDDISDLKLHIQIDNTITYAMIYFLFMYPNN